METDTVDAIFPDETTTAAGAPSVGGLRAGAVVFAGVVALNLATYGFYFVSAHILGPRRYSDLATLVTLIGLISLPLAGAQVWFATRVAHLRAGDPRGSGVAPFTRTAAWYVVIAAGVASVVAAAVAPFAASWLGIGSTIATELAALTVFPAVVAPMVAGVVQGLERFTLLSWAYAAGPLSRLVFAVLAFALGARLDGAVLATLLSMFVGISVPLWPNRRLFAHPSRSAISGRAGAVGRGLRSFATTLVGLLAITSLTTTDIVVAKLALDSRQAGLYGSASVIARVILYLPAAVVAVLLPRVAARTAQRLSSISILAKCVGVTLVFCIAGVVVYAVTPRLVLRLTFGSAYVGATPILWPLGVAMTLFAILNLLLVYDLGRSEVRVARLLTFGAIAQIGAFAIYHSSRDALVGVDIATSIVLLLAHEAVTKLRLCRALASLLGPRHGFAPEHHRD